MSVYLQWISLKAKILMFMLKLKTLANYFSLKNLHIKITPKVTDWLIDLVMFQSVYRQYFSHVRRRLLVKSDQFWVFEVSLVTRMSLLFIEIQWNNEACQKRYLYDI